jgi:hypothetical protein
MIVSRIFPKGEEMNRKLSAGVKIWCVVLLVAFCLGAASLNAKAAVGDRWVYMRPDGDASVSWSPELAQGDQYNYQAVDEGTHFGNTNFLPNTSDYIHAAANETATDVYTLTDATVTPGSASYAYIDILAYGSFGANDVVEASYSSDGGANWSSARPLTPLPNHSGWFYAHWLVSVPSGTLSNYQMKLDRTTADSEIEADIYAAYLEIGWNYDGDDPPDISDGDTGGGGGGGGTSSLYLDPNSLISNSGWTSYPNPTAFVASVNDDPLRQPSGETSEEYISSYDAGGGQEVHTIRFGLEDCAVGATSLKLWFYGSGYQIMYPFKVQVKSGATLIQDWTEINMGGGGWDSVLINQSLSAAQLNALTVEIKRYKQSNPDKGYSKIRQFYAEVIY